MQSAKWWPYYFVLNVLSYPLFADKESYTLAILQFYKV